MEEEEEEKEEGSTDRRRAEETGSRGNQRPEGGVDGKTGEA